MATRRAQESSWAITQIALRSTGSWAMCRCTWATMSRASTLLTTVDENRDLEAYIYIPTERAAQIRNGLASGHSRQPGECAGAHRDRLYFAPGGQPAAGDSGQGAGALDLGKLRNLQQIKARVIWKTSPTPVVPVLAVIRLGGQTFVYVATSQDGKYVAKQRPIDSRRHGGQRLRGSGRTSRMGRRSSCRARSS